MKINSPYLFIVKCNNTKHIVSPWFIHDGKKNEKIGRETIFKDYFRTVNSLLDEEIKKIGDTNFIMSYQDECRLKNILNNLIEVKQVYQEENEMAFVYKKRKQEE